MSHMTVRLPPPPESQPRERSVICRVCFTSHTWNVNAVCDTCEEKT